MTPREERSGDVCRIQREKSGKAICAWTQIDRLDIATRAMTGGMMTAVGKKLLFSSRGLLFATAIAVAPTSASAACQVSKLLELPVTMAGHRPMVTARIGERDVRFILDSGAFYSTLSRASAAELGLSVEPLPASFRLKGIGGDTSASVAVARNFLLAGVAIPKIEFIVGGSDTGTTGLLGQNILGLADIEYDLPHGMVRLMKSAGCDKTNLAYWAGAKPVTVLKLEQQSSGRFKPHTVATVQINGRPVKAIFDTGAQTSLLALSAAKRVGVTPESTGVIEVGAGSGLGRGTVRTWLAPFDSIDVGGEAIAKPKINIADVDFGEAQMLIGADFFLTHRFFVSNMNRTMYVTYEGGPMFGLTPGGARTAGGEAIDLTDTAGVPTNAEGFSRRGAIFASNHKLPEAIADFDKAIAMAPSVSRYYQQRAAARLESGQMLPALSDIDRSVEITPRDGDIRLMRAGVRLIGGDVTGARADMEAADSALPPSSASRLTLGGYWNRVNVPAAALTNYDAWLRSHPEDARRANALNGRCWARAQLNRELDQALSDCNAAAKLAPDNAAYLDSRALVRLRRGELEDALRDYDAALKISPSNAWSLYARGIAASRAGRATQGSVNKAAALALDPRVSEQAKRIGLE